MATNTAIKFFKGNYGSTAASTKSTENVGGIVFDNTSHQIFVGGVAYGGNITDVAFANSVLTITKATGAPVTLDFSDTASASATFEVFQRMNEILGVGTDSTHAFLDYTGTTHISTATTLVDADKKLDAAITAVDARINAMDATNIQGVTATDTEDVIELTLKGVTETDGVIAQGTGTDKVTFAKVAKTGEAEDVTISSISASSTATNVQDALEELANQITAGDVSIDSQKGAFTTDSNSFVTISSSNKKLEVKLNSNGYITKDANGLDLQHVDTNGTSTVGTDIATVNTVKTYISSEIADLDVDPLTLTTISANAITIANVNETDGKIGVSGSTTINVDGTVSSENPLVTKDSISSAIEGLDVDSYEQASVSGDTITIYGINEQDGKISHIGSDVTIKLGSNYNATSNKVALESNITDEINKLDVDTVQAVTYTAASGNDGVKLTFTGIKEEDGKIAVGTGNTELTFAKVATSGTAADVAIVDSNEKYTATDVEGALYEVKQDIAALAGGMRYNGGIANSTATLNTSTSDIRPGDIYLATADFTLDGKSVEAGDMIIYKGNKSSSTVTLDSSNCNIIERETDTMVTAGDALTADQVVFGNGNKSVVISTITKTDLLDAMANANNALQSIGTGTDSGHVTTNVSAKSNNTQNVSVTLKESDVTYSNGTISATDGVLTDDAITSITDYVDYKVGTIVNSLDKPVTEVTGTNVKVKYEENDGIVTIGTITETYASVDNNLGVTTNTGLVTGADIEKVKTYIGTLTKDLDKESSTTDGTNVHVTYSETDGIVTINSVTEDYADVSVTTTAGSAPTMTVTNGTKLAVGSDVEKVKEYTDAKVVYEISRLDSIGTSAATGAVAQVVVEESDGKIGTVTVTNISAGVTGNDTTLSATSETGAVTGADIAKIKAYIDGQIGTAAAVTDIISTITVNDTNRTNIATIGTTNITAAVALVWEEYE